MTIPQMPMFNTPETFGRALSYEGQIHAVLGWYDENADYVNGVREDIDHAVDSIETLDGLVEQAQVAIPAATDAASAANTAAGLANAATTRANTATGNANAAATRANNAAESIESYPLVVAEKLVNPGAAQFLDFGNLAVSGDSTKDGVTVTVDGTELSFSGSNSQGSVFFNFHPDNSIGFHSNTVYHAWMDIIPHDSISRPVDVVLILFGYDSDLQENHEIVRVGTQATGRKEFSFVDPVGYELYTITVYIGTTKTDMTVIPHFDAVMDNGLLSEAETSILSTGISWLSDTLHEGPNVVHTENYTIFQPEWGTRVDLVGTFASDYEYRIRFDDYYRYIEHDRTYTYRLDGRIPFTASILGVSGNGLVQEEETILDTVTNVPGNPAYGTFHIPDVDYDWYDLVYTIPAGTYASNRSIDLRFGTIPDNVYLKRLIDAISSDNILDGSVTTAKLADSAVATAKIADGNVTADKIASNAVTTVKIADGAVTAPKIAAGNVTSDKLASNSVITAKVADGAVTAPKIADGAVTNSKIADGHVNGAKIADGSITTSKLAANSVATSDIIDANVTASKLASNSVTTEKVANGAVTADKLASSAVTTAKVADGAVTADKLASNAVVTAKVADGAVTADKLASESVTNAKVADGAVDSFKLQNGAVTADKLASNAVTTGKIADGAATDAKLAQTGGVLEEVHDIRVGADGTTYPSAGNAVRGQVGELKTSIDELRNPKSDYTLQYVDVVPDNLVDLSEIIDGYYISPSGVQTASSAWTCTPYLAVGDYETLNCQNIGLSAFYDENKTFISSVTPGNTDVQVPSDAQYFRSSILPENLETAIISYHGFYRGFSRDYPVSVWKSQKKGYESGFIPFTVPVNNTVASYDTTDETDNEGTPNYVDVDCVLSLPYKYKPVGEPCKLLMMCHGAGQGVSGETNWTQHSGYRALVSMFTTYGYAVFDCNGFNNGALGKSFWGNQRGLEAWRKAYLYVTDNYNVEKTFSIYAFSMGGLTAMNLAFQGFPNINAIALGSPVLNLRLVWDATDGTQSVIKALYGLDDAWDESKVVGDNPYKHVVTIDNVQQCPYMLPPIKIWYGSTETNNSDNPAVEKEVARSFVNAIVNSGGYAYYREVSGRGHDICYGGSTVVNQEILTYLERYERVAPTYY